MDKSIVIVLGSFHKEKVSMMLEEARKSAKENGLTIVKEIWVPGSLEKPLALKHVLSSKGINGAVVLGIIEKGETKHGLAMGNAVFSAVIDLQLKFDKPIGVGILGPEILPEQIPSRLKLYATNAVDAVKTMLEVLR